MPPSRYILENLKGWGLLPKVKPDGNVWWTSRRGRVEVLIDGQQWEVLLDGNSTTGNGVNSLVDHMLKRVLVPGFQASHRSRRARRSVAASRKWVDPYVKMRMRDLKPGMKVYTERGTQLTLLTKPKLDSNYLPYMTAKTNMRGVLFQHHMDYMVTVLK